MASGSQPKSEAKRAAFPLSRLAANQFDRMPLGLLATDNVYFGTHALQIMLNDVEDFEL